jgi:hypothetical protein
MCPLYTLPVGWTYQFVHVGRVDKRPSNVDKRFVHVEKVGTDGQMAIECGQKFAHMVKLRHIFTMSDGLDHRYTRRTVCVLYCTVLVLDLE